MVGGARSIVLSTPVIDEHRINNQNNERRTYADSYNQRSHTLHRLRCSVHGLAGGFGRFGQINHTPGSGTPVNKDPLPGVINLRSKVWPFVNTISL